MPNSDVNVKSLSDNWNSFLELALQHGAVILTPDYRLMPEHDTPDAINDIKCFWEWTEQGEAQKAIRQVYPAIDLDETNLLVGGESAGGYMAAQTALLKLTTLPIKLLFLQYPCLNLTNYTAIPDVVGEASTGIFAEVFPFSIVEEHLAAQEWGLVRTRAPFGSRMHLHCALVQAGRFCDTSGWLDPVNSLETAGRLPPTLLYQSKEDEYVSASIIL